MKLTREELIAAKIPCAETGIEVRPAICGLCGNTCRMQAHLKEGRVVRVEPMEHMGSLCTKGMVVPQSIYHPDRILYPMKRVGARGEGKFERISWAEAIEAICSKLEQVKLQGHPEETMLYCGHPKWFRTALVDFANAYETPNFGTESSTCFKAMAMGWKASYGKGPIPPDIQNTKTWFLWGSNQAYSDTPRTAAYFKAIERGVTVVAVDPRDTPMTARAALHLKLRPGTDGALALGMAHVIIKENRYDKDFVQRYTTGFDAYCAYVKTFTPEFTASITGVASQDIIAAARLYANQPAAIQLTASPVVHHINGVQNVRAISLLCALSGNYGVAGGNVPPRTPTVALNANFLSGPTLNYTGASLGSAEFPAWDKLVSEQSQVTRLADYLEGKGAYPIRNLISFGMNHHMWPRPDRLAKAFEQVEFFVGVDLFMTESARYADILLPAATAFEREQIIPLGNGQVYYQDKVIAPMGEVKNDLEIILLLAKRMGYTRGELALSSYEDYLRYVLAPTGLSLEELKSHPDGCAAKTLRPPADEKAIFHFPTQSGKIEFVSSALDSCQREGYEGLPVYHPPKTDPDYPLTLCTGCRKPQLFHSRTNRLPWLAGLEQVDIAEIHPQDAHGLNLDDGTPIWVTTPKGRIAFSACVNENGLPGVVHIYHGNGASDINYLLDDSYYDPISGFPGYKSYVCRVEQREEVTDVHRM